MKYYDLSRREFEEKKKEAFESLKEPLQKFINTYCNPHSMIVAQQGSVQLYQGERGVPLDIPD